jgi:hypothetical protein
VILDENNLKKFNLGNLDEYLKLQMGELYQHYDSLFLMRSGNMNERIRIMNEITEKLNLDKLEDVRKGLEGKFEKNRKIKSELINKHKSIQNKIKSIEDKLKKVKVNNKVIEALSSLKGYFDNYKHSALNLNKSVNEIKVEFNSIVAEDKNFVVLCENLDSRMIESGLIEKQRKFFNNLNILKKKIKHDSSEVDNLLEKFEKDEKN